MISPRGLIYPQLPMGWGLNNKKTEKPKNLTRVLYAIESVATNKIEYLDFDQIYEKYGLSKHIVSSGARNNHLVASKYKIKVAGGLKKLYILTDTKANETFLMTIEEACAHTKIKKPSMYQAVTRGNLIKKRYTIRSAK